MKTNKPETGQQIDNELASSFFGRRKGKPLSPRQTALLQDLLPKLRLDPTTELADAKQLFANNPNQLWLEIGFGGAEHMIEQARNNPDIGIIGCEPFINGMVKALSFIRDHAIDSIRLYDEDAAHILDWLPPASIDRIFLLYPDPWHKKRHWKRRFISNQNLERISRVLKPGGIFRFASDIDSYVEWCLEHIKDCKELEDISPRPEDRLKPWSDWQRTRYEKKALREGRKPRYLTYRRK